MSHPKRRLFVLGQPYVAKIRKAHESDEDVVRLCASHESLRVMEREAVIEAAGVKEENRRLRRELEKADRAAMAPVERVERVEVPVPLPAPDERLCRRLRRADGSCRCPGDRCWFLDACERHRRGLPALAHDEWIGHRVAARRGSDG